MVARPQDRIWHMCKNTIVLSDPMYNDRERRKAHAFLADLSQDKLHHRQAAREQYRKDMADWPDEVAKAVRDLIRGEYGDGARLIALDALERLRIDRVAKLSQLIAGFEWQCPGVFSRQAWKALSKAEQSAIDTAIQSVIDSEWQRLLIESCGGAV